MFDTMTDPSFDTSQLLTWEPLTDESLELCPEQIDRAVQWSQSITNAMQQWQVYLQGLALVGFEQWLEEWATDLSVNDRSCSIHQPAIASLMDAVCNLEVGSFKLCLILTQSLAEPIVAVPKAAIDLPQFIPHIYVVLGVNEEQMLVHVRGYLRYDQLIAEMESQPNTMDPQNWNYPIPMDWFIADPGKLLLDLRCLDPAVVLLPSSSCVTPHPVHLPEKLLALLPQLRSPLTSLKQQFSGEEIIAILSTPELSHWFDQAQQAQEPPSSLQAQLSNIWNRMQTVGQRAINVGVWLQDQLDGLAQELSWVLMPLLSPTTAALRSVREELETVVANLQEESVHVPAEARGAYRDLHWGSMALRLYVLTWVLPISNSSPEWTLLLVLGSQTDRTMPPGVRLQVRDAWQLLIERNLTENTQDAYLYAQVVGAIDEQFWVTINLGHGVVVTFSFTFQS